MQMNETGSDYYDEGYINQFQRWSTHKIKYQYQNTAYSISHILPFKFWFIYLLKEIFLRVQSVTLLSVSMVKDKCKIKQKNNGAMTMMRVY